MSSAQLVALGLDSGLDAVAVCPAEVLEPARSVLKHRKDRGLAGAMQFTYRNPQRCTDPHTALPGARSWVVGALRYPDQLPADRGRGHHGAVLGQIARYSWADHYQVLADKLSVVAERLEALGHPSVVVADTNALVDRNVAWLAGLGWYGKNANLLLPGSGSWCVLGTVVTSAELEATGSPLPDGCGRCSTCIEACPTDAIIAPGVVDATACIAWLVQAAEPIPRRYREAVGDRLYGCDDCQTVCPVNRAGDSVPVELGGLTPAIDVLDLLAWNDDEIERHCGRWYIANRDMNVVRRSALVVLGNTAVPGPERGRRVLNTLARYLAHDEPSMCAHAVWAARRLGLETMRSVPGPNQHHRAVEEEWEGEVTARFSGRDWGLETGGRLW